MRSVLGQVCRALLLTLWAATSVSAQEARGTITGTVKDTQGSAMPGVTVTAVHQGTNVTTNAVTNESGVYLLNALQVGSYRVDFMLQGFAPAARNLDVRAGDRLQVDIAMGVGGVTEEVKVVAETPLLETTTATRSVVIDQAKVENLPMSGRNPYTLAQLAPGVMGEAGNRQSIALRPFDNGGMDSLSINGGRVRSNEFLLDGAPNSNNEGNGSNTLSFVPSPDAVQEVRVQTNTYDAQYGRTGGGVISLSVRSGTNQPHGSAYFYERDKALNSNLYENKVAGLPKSPVYHRQPGFTFGGPILLPRIYDGHDKSFFFFSYEHLNSAIPVGVSQKVPTELERAGDFSQSLNGIAGGQLFNPLTGQPFAGNVIPSSQFNPVAAALLKYIPLPNGAPDTAGNNYFLSGNSRRDLYDSNLLRLDHNLKGNTRLSARYAHNGRHEIRAKNGRDEVAAPGGNHFRWNDQISGDLSSTFGPTLVSSLKAGWTMHKRIDEAYGEGTDVSSLLPYSPTFLSQAAQRFYAISIPDYTGAATGDSSGGFLSRSDEFYVTELVTKLLGTHQLKAGGDFRRYVDENGNAFQGMTFGSFTFNRNWTSATPTAANPATSAGGNAFASFLLGYPAFNPTNTTAGGSATSFSTPAQHWGGNYYGAFLQDDWRVNSRWTMNFGLRWDYEAPVSERDNLTNFGFDQTALSPVQVAGLPQVKGGLLFGSGQIFTRDLNNFGPRVGSTYKVGDKTVIRGGYGLTYLPSITDRGTLFGYSVQTPVVSSIDAGRTPFATLTNPFPTGILAPPGDAKGLATALGQNINYNVPDRQIPEYHQYSIGVQRELPWRSVGEISYVGSRTNKLGVTRPINDLNASQLALGDAVLNAVVANPFAGLMPDAPNRNGATVQQRELLRPYPQFGTINEQLVPIGFLRYNALQASWDKRLARGLHMLVSYTFSKSTQATSVLNMGDGAFEELTPTHRPHNLRLSGGWNVPPLEGHGPVLKYLVGGWQVNASTIIRQGTVVGMPTPASVKLIGDPVLANPTRARWFNTCTLTVTGARQNCASDTEQPAFQLLPANALRVAGNRLEGVYGDEPFYMDLSVFKNIPMPHRSQLQLRAEVFNLTNVVQFGAPNTTVTSAQFGTVANSQANDPRNIMVSVRVTF
jgi:Carboxypeptidase regulatory-like domain/TonB-dependent Receptor Plug Domain/TonB dependent receptor